MTLNIHTPFTPKLKVLHLPVDAWHHWHSGPALLTREIWETQEPIEEGYVYMLSKQVSSCTPFLSRTHTYKIKGNHTQVLHFTVCFSVSRENIMQPLGENQPRCLDLHRSLIELIYWICLCWTGFTTIVTHLKANRIYESESSTTQRLWRSTCKQSTTTHKIHIYHLYVSTCMSTWTRSFYNVTRFVIHLDVKMLRLSHCMLYKYTSL